MTQSAPSSSTRSLSDGTFSAFQSLVLKHTGIELAESKRSMIINRFTRRLQVLNIDSFDDYIKLIQTPGHPETVDFIDTITTNLTYFFRESHHFDVLGNMVLPKLVANRKSGDPIRIWSAGCSSGQEPYSIAITALDTLDVKEHPVKILCTDIHSKLVNTTQLGKYNTDQLRGLDETQLNHWFKKTSDNMWQADISLRKLLLCKKLNLFGPWPVRAGVDVIMCRNVLIYFSPDYQRRLLSGFAAVQKTGSYLFIGHSETLEDFSKLYKRVANTVYERL